MKKTCVRVCISFVYYSKNKTKQKKEVNLIDCILKTIKV